MSHCLFSCHVFLSLLKFPPCFHLVLCIDLFFHSIVRFSFFFSISPCIVLVVPSCHLLYFSMLRIVFVFLNLKFYFYFAIESCSLLIFSSIFLSLLCRVVFLFFRDHFIHMFVFVSLPCFHVESYFSFYSIVSIFAILNSLVTFCPVSTKYCTNLISAMFCSRPSKNLAFFLHHYGHFFSSGFVVFFVSFFALSNLFLYTIHPFQHSLF